MIRVYYDAGALYIDGYRTALIAGTLAATATGDTLSIATIGSSEPLAAGTYTAFGRQDGSAFASLAEAMAYLTSVLATPAPVGDSFSAPLRASAAVFAGYGVMYADAGSVFHATPAWDGYAFAGIATQNAGAGQPVVVKKQDVFSFSAWTWTPGEPVFVLAGGVLTQAAPDTGILHQVGTAVDATTILISSRDIIQL